MNIIKNIQQNIIKNKVTFDEIRIEWLQAKKKQKKKRIKKSTYSNYEYSTKVYLLPTFKKLTLKELKEFDYESFIDKLEKNKMSTKTISDIVIKLKSILNYANDVYEANINVRKIPCPRVEEEPIIILSNSERLRLLKTCQAEHSLAALCVEIALNTGLRIGEICALKWESIDLDRREIKVRSTAQRIYNEGGNGTRIIIDTPKSNKSKRNIPITQKLYNSLIKYKREYSNEDFVVSGISSRTLEPRGLEEAYRRLLKKSKINRNYNFHVLRHTFATCCVNVGMDTKTLGEILGHSDVKTTLRYMHSSYQIKKKYMEKI